MQRQERSSLSASGGDANEAAHALLGNLSNKYQYNKKRTLAEKSCFTRLITSRKYPALSMHQSNGNLII